MPMDGIMLGAAAAEINGMLTGGKVDKIYQPARDTLLITVRSNGNNLKLLISASCENPRIYISSDKPENPENAPAFCMFLRKYLTGGRISGVWQYGNERVLRIGILSADDLGDITEKSLIFELMGKYSNIILLDADGFVMDAVKRVTDDMSRLRTVLPHDRYTLPPSQGKEDPLSADPSGVLTKQFIFRTYTGISSQTAAEIAFLTEKYSDGWQRFFSRIKNRNYSPRLVFDRAPNDILPFIYESIPQEIQLSRNYSQAAEEFYSRRSLLSDVSSRTHELRLVITRQLERAEKKSGIFRERLLECANAEEKRIFGELLTAYLSSVPKGAKQFSAVNYYSETGELANIPLDPAMSAQQNAQSYFTAYRKLKTSGKLIGGQIADNDREIAYLNSLLLELDNCAGKDELNEILSELTEGGYIRAAGQKSRKEKPASPMLYTAADGTEILVGKNNRQNDELTLRIAQRSQIWLHIKDAPGSHVVIRSDAPSEQAMLLALHLCGFYSGCRGGANIAIDSTAVKNVKKPRGAKPGMVIYDNYKTYYITPSEDYIKANSTSGSRAGGK